MHFCEEGGGDFFGPAAGGQVLFMKGMGSSDGVFRVLVLLLVHKVIQSLPSQINRHHRRVQLHPDRRTSMKQLRRLPRQIPPSLIPLSKHIPCLPVLHARKISHQRKSHLHRRLYWRRLLRYSHPFAQLFIWAGLDYCLLQLFE